MAPRRRHTIIPQGKENVVVQNPLLARAAAELLLVSLLALGPHLDAQACLNEYDRPGARLDAHKLPIQDGHNYLAHLTSGAAEHRISDEQLAGLAVAASQGDFRDQTNYAVALVRRGQAKQALDLLSQVEAEHPGEYIVAANLGTAYELTGNNSEALRWIRTGIDRNANSHDDTEWLHLKILETKLKLATDPDWLAENSVLGLDFGLGEVPLRPAEELVDPLGTSRNLHEIRAALEYQLHERLTLVEAPDAIVASLLADLANLLVLAHMPHEAERMYGLAAEYNPQKVAVVLRRLGYLERLNKRRPAATPFSFTLAAIVACGAAAAGGGDRPRCPHGSPREAGSLNPGLGSQGASIQPPAHPVVRMPAAMPCTVSRDRSRSRSASAGSSSPGGRARRRFISSTWIRFKGSIYGLRASIERSSQGVAESSESPPDSASSACRLRPNSATIRGQIAAACGSDWASAAYWPATYRSAFTRARAALSIVARKNAHWAYMASTVRQAAGSAF